ncbi:MAG: hypothetical protein LBD23_17605 [Oscillospiraceae bacterium]|jgi:hypothetical protein|nr:hypothetical protein [Oscillospiraceae bacterium]
MNIIYNSNSDHIIKIAIYRDNSSETFFIEANPNGTIVSWIGSRENSCLSEKDVSRFFLSKTTNIFGRQRTRLPKDEINEIFDLANTAIESGNFEKILGFGGFHYHIFYRGVHQKIQILDEENYELYKMLSKIVVAIDGLIFENYVWFI